jgi:hypothetical protein
MAFGITTFSMITLTLMTQPEEFQNICNYVQLCTIVHYVQRGKMYIMNVMPSVPFYYE